MSKSKDGIPGIKFSCPGCEALLKLKRVPARLVQSCPNCRRLLRLHDKVAALEEDPQLGNVIEQFVRSERPIAPDIPYEEDPRLDAMVTTESGIWQFNQPWPPNFNHVLYERAEVITNPLNIESHMRRRRQLLAGVHRRVTMERTGEVEEIAIIGHWQDQESSKTNEARVGALPRPLVRQLNRLAFSTEYAARINCARWLREKKYDTVEIYVDVAKSDEQRSFHRTRIIK